MRYNHPANRALRDAPTTLARKQITERFHIGHRRFAGEIFADVCGEVKPRQRRLEILSWTADPVHEPSDGLVRSSHAKRLLRRNARKLARECAQLTRGDHRS